MNNEIEQKLETIDNILRDIRSSISENFSVNCEQLKELQRINNNIADIKASIERFIQLIVWASVAYLAVLIIHKIFT